jgi:hypothetical protein
MSYTIDYAAYSNGEEIALDDCKAYLKGDRFEQVVEMLKERCAAPITEEDMRSIISCLGFLGIRGFPAVVMAKYIVKDIK